MSGQSGSPGRRRGVPSLIGSHPFLRFLIVGAVAVGLNLVMFWVLVGWWGLPYLLATVVVFMVGNSYGFLANRRWVFKVGDQPIRRLVMYFATMGASLALNLLSMALLVGGLGLSYLLASGLTSVWLTPVNYLAHGRIAFGRGRPPRAGRPRVLLATHFYADHGGGLEIVASQLAKHMVDRFEITWFASGPAGAQGPAGVTVHPMHSWNGLERKLGLPLPIPSAPALAGIVRGVRDAELVWVHDLLYPTNLAAALAALAYGRPLLVTVHVGMIPYRRRIVRALMAFGLSVTGRLVLTRASSVTFVSARVRDEFTARWRMRHEQLVPNGLDTETFAPAQPSVRARVRAGLGIGDKHMVLFVGRFVERKGLGLLHELAVSLPAVEWVFAGSGPMDPAAWGLSNVHVERARSGAALAELYGSADLLVLPSLGEGFPLVVMEALGCGLPVMIDPSTVAGYPAVSTVVDVEAVEGGGASERWARHIRHLLADHERQRRSSTDGVIFAREHWDWDHAGLTYTGLLMSLTRAGGTHPAGMLAEGGTPE